MRLTARHVKQNEAFEFISKFHRHHKPPAGWIVGIGAYRGDELVGVVCVGRPVARMMNDGKTAEVTRLCSDGSKNVCSFLYGRARTAAFAIGYDRVITYILESEPGTSLKASGWRFVREAGGGSWSRPSRLREDKAPLETKQLWEAVA